MLGDVYRACQELTLDQRANVVANAELYARSELLSDSGGHDWWHVDRVRRMATWIGSQEAANLFLVEVSALLHDISDFKVTGNEDSGRLAVLEFCYRNSLVDVIGNFVSDIVARVSFKGEGVEDEPLSPEGRCVRDADRLDAIGAIGVARVFAFGGSVGRPLWSPEGLPEEHRDRESYRSSKSTSLDHFTEKLHLVEARLETDAGKRIGRSRSGFVRDFEERFKTEWLSPFES